MTLFLSDLDGTLIDSRLTIPPDSVAGIQAAIARGDGFSVATARTPATVGEILSPIQGTLPAIVMNGAGIFDFSRQEYLRLQVLAPEKAHAVQQVLDQIGMGGFLYTVRGNHLDVYYENPESLSQRMFRESRMNKPYKTFRQGKAPEEACRVFYCVIDTEERTGQLAAALKAVAGLRVYRYRDVHMPDSWYVEIYDETASKAAGVRFLREYYHFDRVVCFGDNYNDLPLFEAADESCAVAGAVEELKRAATHVLIETDIGAVGRAIGNWK
ncbi:MAG: HAD-IIB family hydrolase [Candidatus Merdivicinus sp.]